MGPEWRRLWWTLVTILSMYQMSLSMSVDHQCRPILANCTSTVYPYLHDPQYMFPTSLTSVNQMCKMWSQFVDCIRRYISNCFEENRRVLFHKSVENSIDTVHAICSSKMYQTEYLAKASCFKQISMDHCGAQYRQLIANVANANSNDEHICCSYSQFRRCVDRPLFSECGRKAKNLMDHSMSFLITRCSHYSYQRQSNCPEPPIPTSPPSPTPSSFGKRLDATPMDTDQVNRENDSIAGDELMMANDLPVSHMATEMMNINDQNQKSEKNSQQVDTVEYRIGMDSSVNSINSSPEQEIQSTGNGDVETDQSESEMQIVYTIKPQFQISLSSMSSSASSTTPNVYRNMFQLGTIRKLCTESIYLWALIWFIRFMHN